jgi:hypothetical protein
VRGKGGAESGVYESLRRKAEALAAELPVPSFYIDYEQEINISREVLVTNRVMKQCVNHIQISQEEMGHGFEHSRAVAIDAGALLIIEGRKQGISGGMIEDLMVAVHIAGLLHDIKRGEEDHALRGSLLAESLIDCFGIEPRFRRYVTVAIRNHEAFGEPVPAEDSFGQLLSDVLYDADKFRWGVDNFTGMVWEMLDSGSIRTDRFLERYDDGLEYIARIKETFRSGTGKKYGPEIIDTGLELGRRLYPYIKEQLSGE